MFYLIFFLHSIWLYPNTYACFAFYAGNFLFDTVKWFPSFVTVLCDLESWSTWTRTLWVPFPSYCERLKKTGEKDQGIISADTSRYLFLSAVKRFTSSSVHLSSWLLWDNLTSGTISNWMAVKLLVPLILPIILLVIP